MAITREELKEILREEIASEFLHIPQNEENINICFSEEFNGKMDKLLKSQKKVWWSYVNTTSKRIAVACIILLALFTTACSFKGFREPIIDFIKEEHEKFIEYFMLGDTTKELSYEYKIDMLPEGFEQTDIIRTDNNITTIYENNDGESIDFVQSITRGITQVFDAEYTKTTHELIGNIDVEFFENDGLVSAIWIQDVYLFELTYYGADSKNDLIQMILSIK